MTERYTEYDEWAWLYNQTVGAAEAIEHLRLLRRVLFPAIPSNARLLDLCCGTGNLTRLVLKQGYGVVGLDGSELMLNFAKANAPHNAFFQFCAPACATDKSVLTLCPTHQKWQAAHSARRDSINIP